MGHNYAEKARRILTLYGDFVPEHSTWDTEAFGFTGEGLLLWTILCCDELSADSVESVSGLVDLLLPFFSLGGSSEPSEIPDETVLVEYEVEKEDDEAYE